MKVDTIPFVCEARCFPRFMFSNPTMVPDVIIPLPIDSKTNYALKSDPQYNPNKFVRFMILSNIENFSRNGVKYS